MSNSKYRQARDLSAIKIARLRAQTPALGSSVKASFKPTATTLKAGIWQSFGPRATASRDGPGGNDPPRPGYRMAREVALARITLPKVSILED